MAAPALAQPCGWGVSSAANRALYERVEKAQVGNAECQLGDQTANQGVIEQGWQRGATTVKLHWAAQACTAGTDARLVPTDLPQLAAICPETAKRLKGLAQAADWPQAEKPKPDDHERPVGWEYQLAVAAAALLVAVLLGLGAWLLWSLRRVLATSAPERAAQLVWWQAGAGLTLLALAVRILVPPSLSNWYTPVLSLGQLPRAELYGSGHIALQWLLRSVLPWSDRVLLAAQLSLGAAAVPLWLVVLRQRGFLLRTAVLAAGLLAVLPLHVRLSNSASEHVLAATAWLGALAAWQAALRSERRSARVALGLLAVACAVLTAMTRLDAAAVLLAIAGWSLAADSAESAPPLRQRLSAALLWTLVAGLILLGLLPWLRTAVVERGTPMPEMQERLLAARDVRAGLFAFAFDQPGWIGPLVGGAGLVGFGVLLFKRPWLTLVGAATFMVVPFALGRSPYDFIMMRYYLPVIPLLTLPAAVLFEPVTQRRWVTPLLLVATLALGWNAWQWRYAFQDEYDWLRTQMAELPADCTLAQVAVANRQEPNSDVDCCLDVARSPLNALYPQLRRAYVDSPEQLRALQTDAGGRQTCVVYYEGAVCALAPTEEMRKRRPKQLQQFHDKCAALAAMPELTPLAATHVSPNSHFPAFRPEPVPVRLLRLGDGQGAQPVGSARDAQPDAEPGAWLVAWWLLALVPGALVGWTLRRALGRRLTARASLWLPLFVMPPVAAALALASAQVGALDAAAIAGVATLTALGLCHERLARPLPWLVTVLASAAALGVLELVARVALPPPPTVQFAPPSLRVEPSPRPDGQPAKVGEVLIDAALHRPLSEAVSAGLRLQPVPQHAPFVVHLGDSMIFGSGGHDAAALPTQLARLLPRFVHLNAGVPGTSLDVQVLLLQRILTIARPSLVVLYAMPGNDVDEVDRPLESCGGQPPLLVAQGLPQSRCSKADWQPRPWYKAPFFSRLPVPLAALLPVSFIVRHLEAAHQEWVDPPRAPTLAVHGGATAYARALTALVAMLQQAHVPLQVVMMPLRRSHYGDNTEPRRRQLLDVFHTAGLQVLDSQRPVDAWVAAADDSAVFIGQNAGEIHLNPQGLQRLAEWLAPSLALPQDVTPP